MDSNTNNQIEQTKQKTNKIVLILAVVGGIVIGVFVLLIALFSFVSSTSKKLVCKSNEGNITIMYNKKNITGYTAKGITYDMNGQKKIAEQIGIDKYIDEFDQWFQKNTTGSCSKK